MSESLPNNESLCTHCTRKTPTLQLDGFQCEHVGQVSRQCVEHAPTTAYCCRLLSEHDKQACREPSLQAQPALQSAADQRATAPEPEGQAATKYQREVIQDLGSDEVSSSSLHDRNRKRHHTPIPIPQSGLGTPTHKDECWTRSIRA